MFKPDKYQELALKTWYKPDHPLYLDPCHPLVKLAGEAGELLDLYGKHTYKPNFSWWKCKYCQFNPDDELTKELKLTHTAFHDHVPLVLDELGDYWYYLRILSFQQSVILKSGEAWDVDILRLLTSLSEYSTGLLAGYVQNEAIARNYLFICYDILLGILFGLNCDLDKLTELNYQKLNSEPSAHGWKK